MIQRENETRNILGVIPQRIRPTLANAFRDCFHRIQEITLRAERPVCIYMNGEQLYLSSRGTFTTDTSSDSLMISSVSEVNECFNSVCGYSVYSHINEIKEGFITLKGGHRVAISGTAVVSSGSILNIRDISTVSVRISREFQGCGDNITELILQKGGGLLLCGAPISGKTTVLRDVSRLLSVKYNRRVSVIDSRGELAATSRGVCQKDVGVADVLDGYPRCDGIEQAIRCLSPEYIVCDEIGSKSDALALISGVNSGVSFVASMHASSKEELLHKQNIKEILSTGAFSQVVFLKSREHPGVLSSTFTCEELLNA